MIKDFDQVRSQLKELADVINSFKSEAVQLRLIELIFSAVSVNPPQAPTPAQVPPPAAKRSRRTKRVAKDSANGEAGKKSARSAAKGRPSGRATLDVLVSEGFFAAPKTIAQIVEHCETDRAQKYKQPEFSGPLMRLVQAKTLTRKKNAEGQYEYVKS